MNKYKLTKGLLALALLAVPMISCTDSVMDDINVDKNHAQDVQAKFIVTDLITSTAFSTVGGDFSTYASVYIEQEAGIIISYSMPRLEMVNHLRQILITMYGLLPTRT